ncbi:MarR family transcriptional regulator [Sphingomonas pokkalii]|uniref:MarR family transcriptional regulator n=1 Tax=Sphingomonas pokkalii TaxID=2175090 RepID=A0A2U0SC13_9SPHN|nr:MarR family transcriptional regulator [Sphingomonas pokkalii]PVX28860.1 MarR family transcriptional regulator [Sphingomonas pokkalii]
MGTAPEKDELVDIVVRMPRKQVENTLLAAASSATNVDERRLRDAKALLTGRRRRAACFDGVRFYDPSWDMILELYVAMRERRQLMVSQLCSLSGGSTTTALRHIEHLEALGYIRRNWDTTDRRRANVTMRTRLIEAAEHWLDVQAAASRLGG